MTGSKTTLTGVGAIVAADELQKLCKALKDRQCSLFLGPSFKTVMRDDKALSIHEDFSEYMKKKLTASGVRFAEQERDFYYLANTWISAKYPDDARKFEDVISDFKKSVVTPTLLLRELITLPFHSIVNLSPDNLVVDLMAKLGYSYAKSHYHYQQSLGPVDCHDEIQLSYNLFGTFEEPKSVAVTDKDQLQLIKNMITENPPIPSKILSRFADRRHMLLFMGFDFNDWPFRMILEALKIRKPDMSLCPGHDPVIGFLSEQYYSNHFSLKFLPHTPEDFVKSLSSMYQQEYGLPEKITIFLDYHDRDQALVEEVRGNLSVSLRKRNIEILDKTKLKPGNLVSLLDTWALEAQAYIPFISMPFLLEAGKAEFVMKAIRQQNSRKSVLPIVAASCAYDAAIENMNDARRIFPDGTNGMSIYIGNDLQATCRKIVDSINFILR